MLTYAKPEHIVAHGGYVVEDAHQGDTVVALNTYPYWAQGAQAYVVFGAGTNTAEFRKITSVSPYYYEVSFAAGLEYDHLSGEPVLFVPDARMNVFWFGAIGDGIADDYPAVRRLMNNILDVKPTPTEIYFPPGRFLIKGTLETYQNITIRGASASSTVLLADVSGGAGNNALFRFYNGESGVIGNVRMADMRIENYGMDQSKAEFGIWFAPYGASTRIYFQSLHIVGMKDTGLYVEGPQAGYVTDCIAENCYNGIQARDVSNYQVSRNKVVGGKNYGIYVKDSVSVTVNSNVVTKGCTYGIGVDDCYAPSIFANSVRECTNNLSINGCTSSAIGANVLVDGTRGLRIGGTEAGIAVTGNVTRGNSYAGIHSLSDSSTSKLRFFHNMLADDIDADIKDDISDPDIVRSEIYSEWIDAVQFIADAGSPVLVYDAIYPNWELPKAALSSVGVWWRVPSNILGTGASKFRVFPYVKLPNDAGKFCVFGLRYYICNPASSATGALTTVAGTKIAASGARVILNNFKTAYAEIGAGGYRGGSDSGTPAIRLSFYRDGASGDDDANDKALLLGISVEFS